MINDRLTWFLESNNIITNFQSGLRHQRSTNDHLIRLETLIREDFNKKEHLVSVFFDPDPPCGTRGRIGPTPPSCEVSKNLTE